MKNVDLFGTQQTFFSVKENNTPEIDIAIVNRIFKASWACLLGRNQNYKESIPL